MMKCPECEDEEELFEFQDCEVCETCWHDYWEESGIGEQESFQDFKMGLKKVEGK